MAEAGGSAEGFGYVALGGVDGGYGSVAHDEPAENGGGEGAARAVGGGGVDMLAGEAMDLAGSQAEQVGGVGLVAGGDDDVQARVAGGQGVGGGFGFEQSGDCEICEGG